MWFPYFENKDAPTVPKYFDAVELVAPDRKRTALVGPWRVKVKGGSAAQG